MLGIRNDQFFRNRLTHNLEVARIVESISEVFQYDSNNLYAVEAKTLTYSLGKPL